MRLIYSHPERSIMESIWVPSKNGKACCCAHSKRSLLTLK